MHKHLADTSESPQSALAPHLGFWGTNQVLMLQAEILLSSLRRKTNQLNLTKFTCKNKAFRTRQHYTPKMLQKTPPTGWWNVFVTGKTATQCLTTALFENHLEVFNQGLAEGSAAWLQKYLMFGYKNISCLVTTYLHIKLGCSSLHSSTDICPLSLFQT
jgi:hypothetical protein